MKLLKKQFIVLSLLLSILCCSIIPCFSVSAAPASSLISNIASYIVSTVGVVNIGTNGGVSKLSGSIMDNLKQKVSDLIGSGIYLDSNGNYVFSDSATAEIYNILDSNDSEYDVRVVSDFGANFAENALWFKNHPEISVWMRGKINEYISSNNSNWLIYLIVGHTDFQAGRDRAVLIFMDITNVDYLLCDDNHLYFRNLNGPVSVPFSGYYQDVLVDSGAFQSGYNVATSNYDNIIVTNQWSSTVATNECNLYRFFSGTDSSFSFSKDSLYNNFPFRSDGKVVVWSSRSIVLAKEYSEAINYLTDTSGTFVANNFTSIPSVSETVINNNNWDNIYNSYVTNVSNDYRDGMTVSELQQILKIYCNQINNAISSGVDDIEGTLLTTNQWLARIFNILDTINNKLDSVGGGSGSGSSVDYSDALQRIENYAYAISTDTEELITLCSYLEDLLNNSDQMVSYLRTIANNTNNDNGVSIPDVWFTLPDMPDSDITDAISDIAVLQTAAFSVVPFCFIGFFGTILSLLSVSPETPQFEIPLKFSNAFIDIDETIDIDFSFFDDLQPLLVNLWSLVFIVVLLFATFKFFTFLNRFFFE